MKTNIFLAVSLIVASTVVLWAQNGKYHALELPNEVKELERLAEQGDTTALHKLLLFLDDNIPVRMDIDIEIENESEDSFVSYGDTIIEEDDIVCDTIAPYIDTETEAFYNSRLDYWLSKGLAINDPIAIYIKGMRLYYINEAQAIKYLLQSAESGNSRAALLCGSAYFNLKRIQDAIKYFTIADELNEPSAGWHLAMCYRYTQDIEKATHYLIRSGLMNYPEAVLELKCRYPNNPLWQHKADSLNIDYPYYLDE